MSQEAPAVTAARAHVEAWGSHDFDAARRGLAPDVKVTATSTSPMLPHTELTGVEPYMEGLVPFASGLERGSTKVIAAIGDDRNALLLVTSRLAAGGPFGTGSLPGARLYLLDDEGRIKEEQVIFYPTAE
jgi:hypothetical protein